MRKPLGYWTKEKVIASASQFETVKDWISDPEGASAYNTACQKGWLKAAKKKLGKPPAEKWTKESCRRTAAKYKTRSNFVRFQNSCYCCIWRNGWLDELCGHMARKPSRPTVACTEALVKREARKFATMNDFRLGASGMYKRAQKAGLLDCARAVLPPVRRQQVLDRVVYEIVHSKNKVVYVGLTYDIDKRMQQHAKSSTKIAELLADKNATIFYSELMPATEAAVLEKSKIVDYTNRQWTVLNKHPGGQVGGAW